MQSPGQVSVPLRAGKKMRKRRELDALAPGGRRLLAGSSDERDEAWPWGSAPPRRARPRRPCAPAARACAALLLCACATATATVVWLFIDVREQITSLRSQIELVSMGSQGVGDALQRCHSTARELQHNHTEMAARLDQLILRTDNLTAQVAALQLGLSSVQKQVASAPELVDVPQQLSSLGTSVAGLGSHFKDFDSTVAALREQSTALTNSQNILNQNITQLKEQLDQMANKSFSSVGNVEQKEFSSIIKKQIDFQNNILQITNNISLINETLATKIDWATQDFKNDHHKVTELLESVQNNSVALSSVQAALRKNYDSIIHNVTEIAQELNDKSIEVQREISNLKQMIHQVEATEAKQISDLNSARKTDSNTMSVDEAASKDDSDPGILPQQVNPVVQNKFENADAEPKITPSKTPPLPITKATPL